MAKVVSIGGKTHGDRLAKELQEKIKNGTLTEDDLKLTKKGQGVEPLDPQELDKLIKTVPTGALEDKPQEKKVVLVGFDRIAMDMRKKVEKLARQKGISTFSIMGIPTRGGVPKFSGGMVGDPQILVEGLYNMAKQRPEIKALIMITAEALKDFELLKVTKIKELHKAGKVSDRLFTALKNAGIHDLKKLTGYTYGEILEVENIGEKSARKLIKMLDVRGMEFKNFKRIPK